jgi:hypothetical protein
MKRNRIHLGIACLTIFAFIFALGPISANAQSTTQGAIAGTVLDQSQAAIPNAAISIQNAATGFSIQLVSDTSGYFKAPLLEPGTYTVAINATNFAKYRAESVTVNVGQTTTLTPTLSVASSSSEVVVTEQTPVMNLESPDFTGTLTSQALQSIPINNRRWSSLAMTTPGVVSDSNGYGMVSVRGISTLLNNVEIDGADDNQAFFSEERGRTREAYSTSANAVREFAVNTGVYSAQYGRAAGGVITSVTKSGTNQIHGQTYFYDRQSNWNAFNNYTTVTSLVNGANTTAHIKPKDLRKIWGFTAGGALIKDKLFWIYTYDQHSHVFPVVGVPYSPLQFYTLPQASLSTGESCNTTTGALLGDPKTSASTNDANACALAARQKISYNQAAYDWAAMLYGSSTVSTSSYPGATQISDLGLNSAIGQVPRFGYQVINTPKIDWQITPKHRASVLYHRLRWDSPGGVQTTAADNYARDAQGNDYVKLDYGVAKLTSLISNNISNEVLYQFGRELNWEGQQDLTEYTKANIAGGGNIPQLEAGYNYGFNAGSMYYAHRTAYPDEHKWQIGDIIYWNKGNHSLKFGVDAVHNYDLMNNTYKSNGDFSYNWVGNMFNDMLNRKNGITPNSTNMLGCDSGGAQNWAPSTKVPNPVITGAYPCYFSFTQGFGNPVYEINTMDLGVFAQDNWKITPRLTLELGLRWDHETMPGPDSNLTTASGSFLPYSGITNSPTDNTAFGPRVGFSYNLAGAGRTVLRGGYGLYYGRITNGNIENIRLNTGSPNGQFSRTWNGNTTGAPVYPNIFASAAASTCTAGTSACPSSYFMSPNLKLPEVMEFDLLLQQDLGKGTVFAMSYLGGLGRRLPNFLNLNLDPTSVTAAQITVAGDPNGKGPLGANGTTLTVPVYTKYGNAALFGTGAGNFSTITEFVSNVNSNYNAMVAEVVNRSLKKVTFNANYTWSHALDFMQNANTQGTANSWYDPFGNPRVNYGTSGYNVPNRFVAYVLYKLPGVNPNNPLKWVTNGWSINDSFQMQNGLPFTSGANSKPSGAIGSSWNGAGGTSIIPQIGYNTQRFPRRIVDDVRIQKEVSFEGGRSVELMLNAFNVANHQNVTSYQASYLYTLSTSGTATTATYTGQDGTGPKTFKVVNNSNASAFLYTPRQVEISARFNF